jgi:hypothetical protein
MDPIGFAAVVLAFAVPLAAIYAWYRVRKLRTEERLAAIAKGVSVPIAEELPPHARSRKAAILLIAGGLGYTLTFMWGCRDLKRKPCRQPYSASFPSRSGLVTS